MPWTRKPRITKQQLADGMERAAAQQTLVLTALGMITGWSRRWKAEAKRLRAAEHQHAQNEAFNLETIRELFAENSELIRRVSDLEAELSHALSQIPSVGVDF